MDLLKELKKFWHFLWYGNSVNSYIAFFIFAIAILNIAYPIAMSILSHTVGISDVVAIVSGSMVHDSSTPQTYNAFMENMGFNQSQIASFPYSNGLNPGDLMFVWKEAAQNIKIGDVIVFKRDGILIIHRVIKILDDNGTYYYTTKGDHNPQSIVPLEINITYPEIQGVARDRIPFLGIPKMILTDFLGAANNVL